LDQPHWSVFHKIGLGTRVHPNDAEAAVQVASWAAEGRIILPASSGHTQETTKWTNADERYQLGVNILTLSRGWHMRDPLHVRRLELRRALRDLQGHCPEAELPIITRDTDAMLSARGLRPVQAPADFPPDVAAGHALLTRATAMVAVMLDDDAIVQSSPPIGWAQAQQRYSDWLRTQDRDPAQKRASIDAMLISDLRTEIAEEATRTGLTPIDLRGWLLGNGWKRQVAAMPSLGLYGELYHQRHLAGVPWSPNDLSDMVYLSCAAGYADFVVAERHMAALLTQSTRRLGRPVTVARRLRDLIEPLAARLDDPADCGLPADRKQTTGP
jgi:hypothetical protein